MMNGWPAVGKVKLENLRCYVCDLVKPISEFPSDRSKKRGVRGNCKACDVIMRKKRYSPEKRRLQFIRLKARNPIEFAAKARASSARARSTPKGKIENAIRSGVWSEIKTGSKGKRKTFDLLGYTSENLRAHLERQFLPGMTWENYGFYGWHIDHIIPLSAYNYNTPDDIDFKRAWALTNLAPMWASENKRKGPRLSSQFQPSLALAIPANDNSISVAKESA